MKHATPRVATVPRLMGILVLAALAMPAIGHAQTTGSGSPLGVTNSEDHYSGRTRGGGQLGGPLQGPGRNEDGPAKPVPEPGTMALASMGLVALGGVIRRHRSR